MTSRSHVGERRGGAGDWLAAAQRHFKAGEGATIVVEWAELSIVLHTSKKTLPLIYQYKKDPLRGGHICVMATSLLGVSLRIFSLAGLISFFLLSIGGG